MYYIRVRKFLISAIFVLTLSKILLQHDIETNPGPIRFPCGECQKPVRSNQDGIACDNCEHWYHRKCINMSKTLYNAQTSITPWMCFYCGIPNFSSSLFTSISADLVLNTLSSDMSLPYSFFDPPSIHQSLENISHASSIGSSLLNSPPESTNAQPNFKHFFGTPPQASTPVGSQKNLSFNSSSTDQSQASFIPKPVKNSDSLRSLIVNFQSLRSKKAEFWNILDTAEPDIIIGTETWLKPEIHRSELFPPTYNVFRKDRKDGYGGVLVATKTTLIANEIKVESLAESVTVSIKTTKPTEPLIICALYRTNSINTIDQMNNILQVMSSIQTNGVVWIGGDLNLPDIDWHRLEVTRNQYPREINQAFLDKLNDMGLQQVNERPTRGSNILDIFLTNRPNLVSRCTTIPPLSDHDIVLVDSKTKATRIKPVSHIVSVWKKADFPKMREETKSFSENINQNLSVEDTWQEICNHLGDMMKKYVPTKKSSTKSHKPWITNSLKRAARKKYRAWRKAKATGKPADEKRANILKKEARRINRQSYQSFIKKSVEEDSGSKNNLYRIIKSKRTDTMGVSPLKRNGLTFSDSKTKANILNDQFCNAFTREDTNNMPQMKDSPHPSMPDITVSITGVQKLLANLNPRKASGPDKLPCRLLKELAQELAPALTILYNKSLSTGEVPAIWKHAIVQPVFKKGDRSQACNYRPISLTCVCCKLLEHIVRSGITEHLEKNKIITDAQHGFRKKRSCETQLILTAHDLAKHLDNSGQTDAILLDFSKAFDKVPHKRLLIKLDFYGIRGKTKRWIENFLLCRTQQVAVEGETSCTGDVISGVPQGSVLGPTLFLIYINDLGDGIKATVRLFADDTMLYSQISCITDANQLQEDLDKLEEWESKWQMAFNVDKCHLLSVTRKTKRIPTNYSLHGQQLERVSNAKYLGVTINEKLNWSNHIHATAAKANRTAAFAYRNLKGCTPQTQATCFKTLARPIAEYASPIWDPASEELSTALEMTQRRAARRIYHDFSRKSSASAMVAKLQLEPLQARRKVSKVNMMYRIMNGLVDIDAPSGLLVPAERSTRGHQAKLMVPYARTDIYRHSFFPSTIKLWNTLHQDSISACSLEAFSATLEGWALKL